MKRRSLVRIPPPPLVWTCKKKKIIFNRMKVITDQRMAFQWVGTILYLYFRVL